MTFTNTGRVIIGSKYAPAKRPKIDRRWQETIMKMYDKDTTAAKSGFFNALPRHIAGLWARKGNHIKGLEPQTWKQ